MSERILQELLGSIVAQLPNAANLMTHIVSEFSKLNARALKAEAERDKLNTFAHHDITCPKNIHRNYQCTCGLDALRAEILKSSQQS